MYREKKCRVVPVGPLAMNQTGRHETLFFFEVISDAAAFGSGYEELDVFRVRDSSVVAIG